MHEQIAVNTRILTTGLTGVQRYLLELMAAMPELSILAPLKPQHGLRGHAWEQLLLPVQLKGRLLWSPSNTGPLAVRRQVVTIHDVVPLEHPEWLNPRFAAWYRFLTPRLARRVVRVITDSEFTKSRLIETTDIDGDKVVVIPIGVSKRFVPSGARAIEGAVAAMKLPTKHYVLSVGSLEPRKNLGRLLKAWESTSAHLPDDVWLVVGGAKGKRLVFGDVPQLTALPPRVFLTGHIPDEHLPALYGGALAFAYPSLYEGFGLPPLEAMAAGTPVLTSEVASIPEVVGEAAVLVDPYDIDSIASGLQCLVEDSPLRRTLRTKGLERAERFTWERTAEQTWRVLQEAAAEGSA